MDSLRVVIGLEAFWVRVRSINHLSLITQTCKTIHSECSVEFAVKAMGKNREVPKIWAQRWLGLKTTWWNVGRIYLLDALQMVRVRGGIRKMSKLALEYRTKDVKYAKVLDEFRTKRERERMLSDLFQYRIGRSDKLRQMATNAGLPVGGKYYDYVLFGPTDMDEYALARLTKFYRRKAEIDALLLSDGLARMGNYYDEFLMNIDMDLTPANLARLRFRQSLWMNDDFELIVLRLRDARGKYYAGIYHDARVEYLQYFLVDDDGKVLGKRPRQDRR
jgi:hypothetical protein